MAESITSFVQFTDICISLISNDLEVHGRFTLSSFDRVEEARFDATMRPAERPFQGETPMKRIPALAFLAAALISMGAARSHAQAVEMKVPFSFNVGSRTLPAGTYRIKHANRNLILINSRDGRFHAYSIVTDAYGSSAGNGKIVFTNYGNRRFLRSVVCKALSMNMELPMSNLERQTRMQEAQHPNGPTELALLTTGEN